MPIFLFLFLFNTWIGAQEEVWDIQLAKNKNGVSTLRSSSLPTEKLIQQLLLEPTPDKLKRMLKALSEENLTALLQAKINGIQNILIAYLQSPQCLEQNCREQTILFLSVPAIREHILQATSPTDNALYAALTEGRLEEASLLIDSGMDLNREIFKSKKTIFMSLIESNPELAEKISARYPQKINWNQESLSGDSAYSLRQAWKESLTPKLFLRREDL